MLHPTPFPDWMPHSLKMDPALVFEVLAVTYAWYAGIIQANSQYRADVAMTGDSITLRGEV